MTLPTVSVIIPSYNRAAWLPETVASVLAQTVAPLEVLIVDDGSTDDTAAVCARFPAPVRYLRQQNAGVSAARNHGMREARGEWFALLDSDDLWVPEKLELQLALFDRRPELGWCATGALTIGPDGKVPAGRQGFERLFALFDGLGETAERFFGEWCEELAMELGGETYRVWHGDLYAPLFFGNFVLPSSVLLRRGVVDRVGGFDESFRLAEETEFFHRVAATFPGGLFADPLCRYRVGLGESLVSPANVVPLIRNALKSGTQAARLRSPLPLEAEAAFAAGRRRLLLDLAWTQLTLRDGAGARASAKEAWRAGAHSPRTAAVFLAGLLPARLLGVLHATKRAFR